MGNRQLVETTEIKQNLKKNQILCYSSIACVQCISKKPARKGFDENNKKRFFITHQSR